MFEEYIEPLVATLEYDIPPRVVIAICKLNSDGPFSPVE